MDPWWKKAVGTLYSSSSDPGDEYAEQIDAAVAKATMQSDTPPQEKHVQIALSATDKPPALQNHLKRAVETRLGKTRHWKVAVKVLCLIHRLLRDGHRQFSAEKMQHFSHISLLHQASMKFQDRSQSLHSEVMTCWARKYALFLANRLQCNRVLKVDVVADNHAEAFAMSPEEIVEGMPAMQQLLDCLLPLVSDVEFNSLVAYAMDMIVQECSKIYVAINTCLFKLLDYFFSMPRDTALKVLYFFKRNLVQTKRLPAFYEQCRIVVPHCKLSDCMSDLDSKSMEAFVPVLEEHIEGLAKDKEDDKKEEKNDQKEEKEEEKNDRKEEEKNDQKEEKNDKKDEEKKEEPLLICWDDFSDEVAAPSATAAENPLPSSSSCWELMLDSTLDAAMPANGPVQPVSEIPIIPNSTFSSAAIPAAGPIQLVSENPLMADGTVSAAMPANASFQIVPGNPLMAHGTVNAAMPANEPLRFVSENPFAVVPAETSQVSSPAQTSVSNSAAKALDTNIFDFDFASLSVSATAAHPPPQNAKAAAPSSFDTLI